MHFCVKFSHFLLSGAVCVVDLMMMISFICSCRNIIGAELHLYLEEGTCHKRLFEGLALMI